METSNYVLWRHPVVDYGDIYIYIMVASTLIMELSNNGFWIELQTTETSMCWLQRQLLADYEDIHFAYHEDIQNSFTETVMIHFKFYGDLYFRLWDIHLLWETASYWLRIYSIKYYIYEDINLVVTETIPNVWERRLHQIFDNGYKGIVSGQMPCCQFYQETVSVKST